MADTLVNVKADTIEDFLKNAQAAIREGKGEIGQKIIETARQHGVPIQENAALAGALSEVEIGDEIPLELYKAVAEVLLFLMRMSGRLNANTSK